VEWELLAISAFIDYSKMAKPNGEHPFGDLGQLILLGLFLVIWVGDSFVLHLSTFLSSYVPLPLRLLVTALALIAAFLLVKSGHVVTSHGNHGQLPTSLVMTGAFRYVRHPLYLGCLLVYLGLAVATASLLALALLVVAIFPFYNFIATYEESLLEDLFGESYRTYRQTTGKWLPKMK
jgi:protein-S-isoprenylcysteine O-methyltransferase Ste14